MKTGLVFLIAFFIIISSLPCFSKENVSKFIGLEHPPLPIELENIGGTLIADNWAFKHVHDKNKEYLFLDNLISMDSHRKPHWQVTDVFVLPKLPKGMAFVYLGCKYKGSTDPSIIAVIEYEDKRVWEKIKKAWRANLQTGKFESTSVKDITCEPECYGNECD